MKKEYTTPEIEVSQFDVEDIITMSGATDYSNGTPYDDITWE